jgi:competence protein ComEC
MRYVAAVPAAGLLAGAAIGVAAADLPQPPVLVVLILAVAAAAWAGRSTHQSIFAAAIGLAFFSGGALLAADAWQRAWHPRLRIAFEGLARDQRAAAAREGRRLPEDEEAFAIVHGTLRADAAPTDAGVSLSIAVDAMDNRETGRASRETGSASLPGERLARWSASLSGERLAPGSASLSGERPAAGGILVTVTGTLAATEMTAWRAGRHVRLPVQLHRAARYLDPGVPDHERALARRGTTLVGTVKSAALVDVIARGTVADEALSAARAFSRRAIAAAVGRWSAQSAAIVAAIVIGDRAGLDPDVQRRLQEAGTYHVIAISGGNIAILAGLFIGIFRFAGWLGRTAMLLSIAAVVAYAAFVGNGASVDRATLMAAVYFAARAIDHRSPPLNALAVTAALLVLADPLAVADPAFVLTIGATLAILAVVPVFTRGDAASTNERRNGRLHAVGFAAWTMLAASAAAEAILFPVAATVFSRVTFAGLALNFLAIPLMAVAQIAGMLLVAVAGISTNAAAVAGFAAHVGAWGLVASADLVRFAPFLAYRIAPPSIAAVATYYAAVALWWTLWRRRVAITGSRESSRERFVRRASAAAAVGAALWILIDPRTLVAARGDGRLHLTAIDVGQGDAIFVVFPHGSTLLVDAGGLSSSSTFDIGDRVVAPVVRDAGFRRLDRLALTHGDPDHVGGAAAIVAEFRPREVWEGIPVPRSEPLARLRMLAQARGARWANVYAGDHVLVDEVDVIARHPAPADWERQRVRNDDSIVLELRWRDVSIVLTGDAGKAVEHGIAAAFPPARLRVVKIPHHGSLTSSSLDFVTALHPQVAIVSAGRANHFGHPVPEVLDRYRAVGAHVYRTDQDGAVTVTTDGYTLNVDTFAPPPRPPRRHEDTKEK